MSGVIARAVSYLDREGFGRRGAGLSAWPEAQAQALRRGETSGLTWPDFLPAACPRFGRMDGLAKLGVLAVELLGIDFAALSERHRDRLGVCLGSREGSIAADRQFLQTASPTTFTYTLPSTAIGEICIRHRLRGPLLCLMDAEPGGRGAFEEAVHWLATDAASACLALYCEAEDGLACAAYLERGAGSWPDLPPLEWCRRACTGPDVPVV